VGLLLIRMRWRGRGGGRGLLKKLWLLLERENVGHVAECLLNLPWLARPSSLCLPDERPRPGQQVWFLPKRETTVVMSRDQPSPSSSSSSSAFCLLRRRCRCRRRRRRRRRSLPHRSGAMPTIRCSRPTRPSEEASKQAKPPLSLSRAHPRGGSQQSNIGWAPQSPTHTPTG